MSTLLHLDLPFKGYAFYKILVLKGISGKKEIGCRDFLHRRGVYPHRLTSGARLAWSHGGVREVRWQRGSMTVGPARL